MIVIVLENACMVGIDESCLTLLENPRYKKASDFLKTSNHFKKASIPLKMYLKSLTIFENPHIN
jgi:hypothetical protein